MLAVSMRQLVGSVTFAGMSDDPQDLAMRLLSCGYSLWATPTLILVPLLAGEPGWDFAGQSQLAMARFFGAERDLRQPLVARSA